MKYVPLQIKTSYSLLSSLIKIPNLIEHAKKLGYKSLTITDHNNMFGVPEFYNECKKNIVCVILQSYGYNVIDLGKDVPTEAIVEAYNKYNPMAIGLSALMTTTVTNMAETIKELKKIKGMCPIFVGGAVMTPDIAHDINADYYSKDPLELIDIIRRDGIK